MKAMIFAAGKGTRLKPWTDSHPKALAEVDGQPVIERAVGHINSSLGITEFIVNIHHFGNQVRQWASQYSLNSGYKFFFSDESHKLLETGGGLLKAENFFIDNENIIVHNSDILTDLDFSKMLEQHKLNKADVTLLCTERKTDRKLIFNQENTLKGWINLSQDKRIPENLKILHTDITVAFCGIHIVSKNLFPYLNHYSDIIADDVFSLVPFYLWAKDKIKINSFIPENTFKWIDIGKPESLLNASKLFSANE